MKSLGLLLKACFASPLATVFSLALLALALTLGAPLLHWAVLDAKPSGRSAPNAARRAAPAGAWCARKPPSSCWAAIPPKNAGAPCWPAP